MKQLKPNLKHIFFVFSLFLCLFISAAPSIADNELLTKSFLQEAWDDCDDKREQHMERCKKIFEEQEAGYVMRFVNCGEGADKDYAECMEPDNILKSAKEIKFQTLNKKLLDKMKNEEKKSLDKLEAAMRKCDNKKKREAKEKCVLKAMNSHAKRDAKIEKKYKKKFIYVE